MTTSIKFIVSFVVLVFVSMSLYAKTITITRSGGGPDGFKEVRENHSETAWPFGIGDVSTLDCTGAGYTVCEWMYPPRISAIPQVEDEIDAGNYSGTLEFTHRGGEVSLVVWEGTGPYNVLIEETITLPDSVVE